MYWFRAVIDKALPRKPVVIIAFFAYPLLPFPELSMHAKLPKVSFVFSSRLMYASKPLDDIGVLACIVQYPVVELVAVQI